MAQDITGRWPWEFGKVPLRSAAKPDNPVEPPAPFYTLPTVRDRKAEGGRRPVTARELAGMKRERDAGETGYFEW